MVKPNNGTGGDCVFKVSTISELNDAVKKVFARFDAMAISPFMEVEQEYRLIVLDGEIELAYLKKRKCNE
ncbi:hypothetical protein FACS1894166_06810 [Bacilli bacterium]|nr:hypothetical protein FACS1894166_06810 [Bacilli bacterium]